MPTILVVQSAMSRTMGTEFRFANWAPFQVESFDWILPVNSGRQPNGETIGSSNLEPQSVND